MKVGEVNKIIRDELGISDEYYFNLCARGEEGMLTPAKI
jgi:hypothetical protein